MRYVSNAFSLNMIASSCNVSVSVYGSNIDAAKFYMDRPDAPVSIVGHEDTARIFSSLIGEEIAFNRANVTLAPGDEVLVGQYRGPRLPEGASKLPEGASIEWIVIAIR